MKRLLSDALRQTFAGDTEACPDDSQWQRFALRISEAEGRDLALHLAWCAHCLSRYRRAALLRWEHARAQRDDAQSLWDALSAWMQAAMAQTSPPLGVTRSPLLPSLNGVILDAQGNPTGQHLALPLESAPEVRGGVLRLVARVTEPDRLNDPIDILLVRGGTRLQLGRAKVLEGRLEVALDLSAAGAKDAAVSADRIQIAFYDRA